MTARRNGSSGRRSAPPSSAAKGGSAPDQLGALQQQLTRQLQQTVEDTISAVCDDFQHEFRQLQARVSGKKAGGASIPAAAQYGAASTADYEMYYSCCKRLVAYIAANMTTSPDFVAQMDRIILACHSKAPERVLRTVATKNVWFHRRDGAAAANKAADSETDDDEPAERPVRNAASVKHSPRQIKKEHVSPARPARAARKVAEAPPTRGAAAKRRSPPVPEPPVAKRQRPARRSLPLPDYDDEDDDDDEEEEEEEEEEVVEEEEEEEDNDEDNDSADSASNQPHLDVSDELLDFKDHVRDLCYVDKRTPAQTKFFKERLRKAILFVDAQLCKPPPGKVCGCDCKKIRAVMCDRTLPCRNKICRVWHDVEVHIDRCENTHCELKNRIMLRETMHKIDHKKLQIQSAKAEVAAKKTQRDAIKRESVTAANDRELFIELTLLTNEIEQLESEIAAAEEELGILNGTKKAFWACLNVVGIELKDDVADGFPDLAMHYVTKKQPAPRTRAPKRAAKDLGTYVPEPPMEHAPVASQPSGDDGGLNDDGAFDPMAPITRRTTRRSTTKTFQAMSMDVVSVESDDEAKSSGPADHASGAATDASASGASEPPSQQQPATGESDATASTVDDSSNTVETTAAANASSEFPATQDLSDLSDLLPQSSNSSVEAATETQQVGATTESVEVTTTTTVETTTVESQVVVTQEIAQSTVETSTTTIASSSTMHAVSVVVPPAPVAFPDAQSSPVNNIQILPSIGASTTTTTTSSSSDTDAYAQLLAAAAHAATNPSV